MIAWFLSNISAKYYKNLSMLSRVIAKNVKDVFLRHSVCVLLLLLLLLRYNELFQAQKLHHQLHYFSLRPGCNGITLVKHLFS